MHLFAAGEKVRSETTSCHIGEDEQDPVAELPRHATGASCCDRLAPVLCLLPPGSDVWGLDGFVKRRRFPGLRQK